MGRYVFKLPDVGEGTTEVEITKWHVGVGDTIAEDEPLVDVATDKAVVEIPAPVAGTVVSINGAPGDSMPVGAELVVFETAAQADRDAKPARKPEPASVPSSLAVESAPEPPSGKLVALPGAGDEPSAAPAVRSRARELGIELRDVAGSGPGGRISHADLDAHLARPSQNTARGAAPPGIEEEKLIGVRRRMAERMQQAKRRIPHFSYVEEVDMTALEALREHLNARHASERPKLTLLPFLIKALARAVPFHPEVNALFDDDRGVLRRHQAVHVGIATQTQHGLLVPVLRYAEARTLWDCAAEITRLAKSAREGKASREELGGSTITLTSLGALGGLASTPIINYPEVAIIGVNKLVERPVIRHGQIVARKMMNLSSSFDHRVVDGWNAAAFIQKLKEYLEQPATLFID